MRTKRRPYRPEGGIVALARLTAKLTQRELAELSGVPQSTIARIEAGSVAPKFETISRILAGAGLEMRIQLAPLDDHDQVLQARYESLSDDEKTQVDRRHLSNVEMFRGAGKTTESNKASMP
ncbi:helix-turn-helix transcriptional regulator [Ferrimicrobium sp.]|uniref:helix-turn-helix domain-containing protein n=1 Tax=Ferrimicrobium sp. TaxID=2926050 RepID=UPI00345053A1